MSIKLGHIAFDKKKLFRQFRNDLKDDWFPDPFVYKDVLDTGILDQQLAENFEKNEGKYVPGERTLFNIPKPNFTLRYALETGIPDRILYHGLVSHIVPFFDPLIPWFVFSHRKNSRRNDSRYLFRSGIPAWRDFLGTVQTSISSETFLLSTDLANYFEHIDLMKLQSVLEGCISKIEASTSQKSEIRAYLSTLFDCLKKWSFEPSRGLPQNRDASSFLANMYMLPIDLEMEKKGYSYFRYMDDIKVVCSDKHEARKALKDLSISLREIGLAINSKKTSIICGSDEDKISESLDAGNAEMARLGAIWATRSAKTIPQSFPDLRKFTEELLNDENVDSREFRFCINRLTLLALCEEFSVPVEYFAKITSQIVGLVPECPSSTDTLCRYLLAVPLGDVEKCKLSNYLMDKDRRIYGWQNYRLWFLLAQREFKNSSLMECALEIVRSRSDCATRSGATMYIGCVGSSDQRKVVAKNFKSLNSFVGQRCALIAVHEIPFHRGISEYVAPHVRDDLKNVYRTLRVKQGQYFAPVESVSITSIVDQERDYD